MLPFYIPPYNQQSEQPEHRLGPIEGQSRVPQRIYFLANRNQAIERSNDRERVVVVVDSETLTSFVKLVYIYAISLIVFACVAWSVISYTEVNCSEIITLPTYVWLLGASILLLVMMVMPQMRYYYPINMITMLLCYICTIMAGFYLVEEIDFSTLMYGYFISALIITFLYCCGAFCPANYLPGIPLICLSISILTIILTALFTCLLFVESLVLHTTFTVLIIVLNMFGALFQAQYIHGRFDIVPLFDTVLSCLIIYLEFAINLLGLESLYAMWVREIN